MVYVKLFPEISFFNTNKHINVKYHYLRHQVAKGFIRLAWVPTAKQEADIFTKALPHDAFIRLRQLVMG